MLPSINTEQKVSILVSALEERYHSLHVIRERVQNVGVWSLGLLLTASGWLIQSETSFTLHQKTLLLLGVLVSFYVLRFRYLEDLQKGFKNQQRIVARLEKTLGLFTSGFFDAEEEPIYPKSWEDTGKGEGDGKFFQTTYLLLYVGFAFLAFAIFFSCTDNHRSIRYSDFDTYHFYR